MVVNVIYVPMSSYVNIWKKRTSKLRELFLMKIVSKGFLRDSLLILIEGSKSSAINIK